MEHKSIQTSMQKTRSVCIEKAIKCSIQQQGNTEIKRYIVIAVNETIQKK